MKKYIAILLAILVMSFCLSFSVSAEVDCFTLSEDLMSLTLNGQTYVRMDTSNTSFYYFDTLKQTPQLSPDKQEQFIDWNFTLTEDGKVVDATLYYRAGGYLSCSYVLESFAPKLEAWQKGDGVDCRIAIDWDTITVPETRLKGQPITLTGKELSETNSYFICADTEDNCFEITTGTLLISRGNFYYVDHSEQSGYITYFDPYEYDSLECYQITDEALCKDLSDLGLSEASLEFLAEIGAKAFVIFIFGMIPAAILVLALAFLIKRKGYYKVTWGITAGFCVAELITFVTVLVNLNW